MVRVSFGKQVNKILSNRKKMVLRNQGAPFSAISKRQLIEKYPLKD